MGSDQTAGYSVDVARNEPTNENTLSGSLQKQLPTTSLSGSASRSPGYWQVLPAPVDRSHSTVAA